MMKSAAEILGASSYKEKLGGDEWKAFSKSIRQVRDVCDACRLPKTKGEPLQVHHLFYDYGREPWEYDSTEVVVLCRDCHAGMHDQLKAFRKHVFRFLTPRQFQVLNGALAVGLTLNDPLTFVHALAEFAGSPRTIANYARAWGDQKSL